MVNYLASITAPAQGTRLLAVDPSLTQSGWVLFSARTAAPLISGVITPPGPSRPLAERLAILQRSIEVIYQKLQLGSADFLIAEGPAPLVLNPGSALKVEQVRSIFESVARSRGVIVPGRINPRTVQSELLGLRGKQLARKEVKLQARVVAERLYSNRLPQLDDELEDRSISVRDLPQDIVDALLIGAVAVSKLQLAERLGTNVTDLLSSSRSNSAGSRSSASWRRAR